MLARAHIGIYPNDGANGVSQLIRDSPNSVIIHEGYAMKKSTTAEGARNFCNAMASLQSKSIDEVACDVHVFKLVGDSLVEQDKPLGCREIATMAQGSNDKLVDVIKFLTIYVTVCKMPSDLNGASDAAYGCAAHVIQVFSTLGCGQATAVWANTSTTEPAGAYGTLEAEAETFDDAASESSDMYAATDISDLTNFTRRSLYVFN